MSQLIYNVISACCLVISVLLTICTLVSNSKRDKETKRLNKINREFIKQQMDSKKREQANKFAIWVESPSSKKIRNKLYRNIEQQDFLRFLPIRIQNNSNTPIYSIVVITINTQSQNVDLNYFKNIKRSPDNKFFYKASWVMPPGKTYALIQGYGRGMGKADEIVYFFKDSNDIYWFRGLKGKLEQLQGEEEFVQVLQNIGFDFFESAGAVQFEIL